MNSWRDEWHEFEDVTYLNAASQGPLPKVSLRAAQQALEWKKFPQQIPDEAYFGLPTRVRAGLAALIGARPEEIALTSGASSGLAAVALGLDWKPDDEVLLGQGDFPIHFTTFLPLARTGKLRVNIVKPRGRFLTANDFVEQLTSRTRLVSASLVRFDDGVRIDAAHLGQACRQNGTLLLLDAAQCAGAMPIDVKTLGADFVTAAGYKWLLGPYGTGFFWARADRIAEMPERPFYWMAAEGAEKFDSLANSDFRLAPGARRWDAPETANFFNLSTLDASLTFLQSVGVDTVWQHCRRLITQMIERLPLDHYVLASPADPAERGPYACIAVRKREETPAIYERLREANIIVSLREGKLRIAPHLYNSERDIDKLLTLLTT